MVPVWYRYKLMVCGVRPYDAEATTASEYWPWRLGASLRPILGCKE